MFYLQTKKTKKSRNAKNDLDVNLYCLENKTEQQKKP